MSESGEFVFYSSSILKTWKKSSSLTAKEVSISKPNFAYESLVEGCHSRFNQTIFDIEIDYKLEPAQKWITFPGKHQVHFPLQTILPKVQMLRHVPLKSLPRDVEVDRRRRQYFNVQITQLLQNADIPNSILIGPQNGDEESSKDVFERNILFGLHIFDDESFDTNTITGWLDMGLIDDVRHPLPAWALIKTSNGVYSWEMVAVYSYDEESFQFNIIDLRNAKTHKVYRIHLMFMAENRDEFLKRIEYALKQRREAEAIIRLQMLLDCTLLDEQPSMNQHLLRRIMKLFYVDENSCDDSILKSFCDEIQINYHRVMVYYELEAFLLIHNGEFPFIKTPPRIQNSTEKFSSKSRQSEQMQFENLRKHLRILTLFYSGESINAMLSAAVECVHIESFSLFMNIFTKPMALSEFLSAQESTSSTVIKYLKHSWSENLSAKICLYLRSIGKGWLDLSISDWNIFRVAKISRFFFQIKLRMQESLQVLMEKSILSYSNLLNDPCLDFLDLKDDFIWTNDYLTTPFDILGQPPVFKLVLQLCDSGPFYSTDPTDFEPSVTKLLYTTLMSTCGIRTVEPDSLLNMCFDKNLYISTVELIEDMYVEHVERLHLSYSKAVIPLNAYLQKYNIFVDFHELVVDEFVQDFAKANKSSQEIKTEIIWQKEQKEELKTILPDQIVIGTFQIFAEPLKKYLINKRTEIIRKLFLYYVDRMFKINEDLLQELLEINGRLHEKLLSIEHLFEIKNFMTLVPDRLTILRERIQIMMLEYNVLDSFFYNLSDQQFSMKWEAFGWPHKIMKRLFAMKEEHKVDIEEFKRIQIRELASFQERLESLNEEIMTFSLQFNPEKAQEVAVGAKKTWKLISDLQKVGTLLQERQVLFESDKLHLDYLESITESFKPYREMWTACSDFIKLEEMTAGNPISSLDLNEIRENTAELARIFENSVEIFKEKEEIQNVSIVYLQRIQHFYPLVEVIECIKNEHWLLIHWQEFSQRSGVDIKFSIAMNFAYCIKKGILNHAELVKEIAEKAILDADTIRLAMEEEERFRQEAELALLEKKMNRKCRVDIL